MGGNPGFAERGTACRVLCWSTKLSNSSHSADFSAHPVYLAELVSYQHPSTHDASVCHGMSTRAL